MRVQPDSPETPKEYQKNEVFQRVFWATFSKKSRDRINLFTVGEGNSSETQAVGYDADAAQGHGGSGDHRIEQEAADGE